MFTIHQTTSSIALCVGLLSLAACNSSNTPESKDEPAADAKPEADAKPDADAAKQADASADADAPEGYEPLLTAALGELAAGSAIATAETKSYGCSVKYGDANGEATAKVGEPAPAFTLPQVDGEEISLSDFAGKTVVLEWFNPDCPFVKYAHGEGPLKTMAAEQTKAGVVWLAINSGAPGKQGHGAERNREAAADWGLEHPILLDESGEVGKRYGAKTTPHMFVVDGEGKLVYAGGLDNAPLGQVE